MLITANTNTMLWLVLAVIFLHLLAAPITVSASVYADSDADIAAVRINVFFFRVLNKKVGMSDVLSRAGKDKSNADTDKPAHPSSGKTKFAICLVKSVVSVLRIIYSDLHLCLGMDDAAATAVTLGSLRAVYDGVCATIGADRATAEFTPEYNRAVLRLKYDGIFCFGIANIIYMFIAAAVKYLSCGGERSNYASIIG